MFLDVPALFTTDGVSAEVLRAGEPRLRKDRGRYDSAITVPSSARARLPILRRSLRPTTA